LKYIDAKRLVPAPDCGMQYLTRESAFGKLKALSADVAMVRRELT
jgi:5-methyltetrahydropteroyltriglutamate--homocysteine methyltransferase